MGNNGIWALEKHPMEFLYGYSVAADLRPGTRYDQLVQALGGHGELVERPEELRAGAGAGVRGGRAGAGERADGPDGRCTRASRTWLERLGRAPARVRARAPARWRSQSTRRRRAARAASRAPP